MLLIVSFILVATYK